MADSGDRKKTGFDLDSAIDVFSAVLLGIATVCGAFAAYEAALWGGNQQSAYVDGTNKLGEANRELLRGVQEQAFDTTVWIEHMKAEAALAREEAAAQKEAEKAGAAPAEAAGEDDDAPLDAAGLVAALAYVEDAPIAQKLQKLMTTRRDLQDANKWAEGQYEKRMKALNKEQMLQLANKILDSEKKQEEVVATQLALIGPLGLPEDADESDIEEALAKNDQVRKQFEDLEVEWSKHQKDIEAELDKLSKPMFFESPEYEKKKERVFKKLSDEGNKLIADGSDANRKGDAFTLTTVLFTVTLFFAGMASTLKRVPIKATFVLFSLAMFIYSLIHLFRTPFA